MPHLSGLGLIIVWRYCVALFCGVILWRGRLLQCVQPADCVFPIGAAHLDRRLQARTACRALRAAKDQAAVVLCKLDAPDAGRLATGHARNRAGHGRGDAARAAIVTTVHGISLVAHRHALGLARGFALEIAGHRR